MSYSNYLWNIAVTLRSRVYGEVPSEEGRDVVQNCIRVLTALANALERDAPPGLTIPPMTDLVGEARCTIREAAGPPENAGLYLTTAAAIAQAVARIEGGATANTPSLVELARWEHRLLSEAVRRMSAVETGPPVVTRDPTLGIDRDRLERFLRRRTGFQELVIDSFAPALGGRSRQTALFSVSNTAELPVRMVVQRALPGMAKSAAFCGPEVEYRVLDTLFRAGLKVPRPLILETDQSVLDGPFVVVEQSPGRLVQPDYWAPPDSGSIALQLAQQMALLHTQPVQALAEVLPRSRSSTDRAAWLAELDGFETLWRAQSHGASVTMSAALAWLRANVDCVQERQSVVHNDMVFHNILADDDRITAILDWEQTSIGHPAEDLGYCYPVVSAVVDWQRFMDAYVKAGGANLSQREIDYFSLRAIVRLMTLVQQGRDAFEGGTTNDILIAGAGAFFAQRLLHRLSVVLTGVLGRS
jgi:aminoglycoside phosphotransferase (APT) family kinase protein